MKTCGETGLRTGQSVVRIPTVIRDSQFLPNSQTSVWPNQWSMESFPGWLANLKNEWNHTSHPTSLHAVDKNSFSTSALSDGEFSASRPGRSDLAVRIPVARETEAGWEVSEK
jgi:hypothetical protein